jgi:LysM repeat protein
MYLRAVAVAVLGCCAATGLRMLWPDWPAVAADLAAAQDWTQRVDADQAAGTLAGVALWLVCAWLCVGLVACLASRLPGAGGRAADVLASLVLPRALYRLAVGAVGLGVLAGPVAATAQPAAATPAAATPAAATPAAATPAAAARGVVPAPVWPTDTLPAPTLPVETADPAPTRTAADPAPTRPDPNPRAPARTITVRAGDSLWRIAAAHLPAPTSPQQVAAAWPRWYAANRAAIGPDPNQLVPGQLLRAPSAEQSR